MDQPAGVRVSIDTTANAAYIELSDNPVARTDEYHELINIDLDAHGVVVGIEILGEGVALPFADLMTRYHVRSEIVELLRRIRPNVMSYASVSTGNDGISIARAASPLTGV